MSSPRRLTLRHGCRGRTRNGEKEGGSGVFGWAGGRAGGPQELSVRVGGVCMGVVGVGGCG